MTARRHPRTLHQVSHLFLSTGSSAGDEVRSRVEAVVWLVDADGAANRAFLSAGIAAALGRQGLAVSLCELAGNLPNVGYYFGLEPADYLAAALDRRSLVTGTWNGSVRFVSAPEGASIASRGDTGSLSASPHVVVGAVSIARSVPQSCAALESSCAVFATRPGGGPARPEAILLASSRSHGARTAELAGTLRARHPESLIICLGAAASPLPAGADECLAIPPELASSMQRRHPCEAPFFAEAASFLVQRLGSRRRRSAGAVNE